MPGPSFNPFYPGGYAQQLQIQRNQAIAEQLAAESQQPIQVPYGSRASQFQGVNKLAQALIGAQTGNRALDEAQEYSQNQSAAMANMFGQQPAPQALAAGLGSSGGTLSPQDGGAPVSTAPQQAGLPGPTDDPRTNMLAYMLSPEAYAKGMIDRNMPTNEQKNIAGGGQLAFKTGYVPPVENRGTVLDPQNPGRILYSNPTDSGYQATNTPEGGTAMRPMPIAGANPSTAAGPFGVAQVNAGQSTPINSQGQGPIPILPGGQPVPENLSAPQAPESPTNIGASINSPTAPQVQPTPQTLPEAIAQQAAAKAGGVTGAEDTAKNLAEAHKTFAIASAGLPQVLQRLQDMQAVAKDASYGTGIDAEGEGWLPTMQNNLNTKTSQANAIMRQKPAQNIIAELGPQLAQGGMRGNKFLETLSSKASGINLDDSPSGKAAAINGLQTTYIGNLKAEAAAIRAQGGQAPSDADIDAQVAQIDSGLHQEGQTATNPQTGQKAVYHYGQWKPQ